MVVELRARVSSPAGRTLSFPVAERATSHRLIRLLRLFGTVALLSALFLFYVNAKLLGDQGFYYQMVEMSQHGLLPFIDYWSEYPPLFPLLLVGVQRALG